MKDAFLTLGRGVGQVMFQNNALSGLLMLAGILLNSWQMALLAIAGNVVSTLTACLSGFRSFFIIVGCRCVLIRLDSPSFQLAAAGAGIYRSFHPFGVDIVGCLQRDDAVFAIAFRKCSDSPVTLFFAGFLSEHRSGDVSGEYSIGRSALPVGYHG